MPSKTLLIRADAGAEIGVGHVMRCLALAQEWRNAGGRAIFAMAQGATELDDRLRSDGAGVARIDAEPGSEEDAAQTKELCERDNATWLVVDGFHFLPAYCTSVRKGTSRLLLVDDHGERSPYQCDLVLNMNPQASDAMYSLREKRTRLLLGSRYALLRQEFLKFRRKRSEVPSRARRILITFGGADRQNVTLKVFQALQEIDDFPLDITVIAGASNPNRASLRAAISRCSHVARLVFNVNNIPEYMAQSELAITAGGGTCFELAFMKVPMFLLTIAENHERTVEAYGEAGAAVVAGWFDLVTRDALAILLHKVIGDRKLRRELRENARRMVDGRGAQRVVETMRLMSRRYARIFAS